MLGLLAPGLGLGGSPTAVEAAGQVVALNTSRAAIVANPGATTAAFDQALTNGTIQHPVTAAAFTAPNATAAFEQAEAALLA